MDYRDVWTIPVWTTKTNRLKVFRQLGVTEIVHYDHVRLFANTSIHTLLAGNEEDISDRTYQWINYIKTFYTGYFDPDSKPGEVDQAVQKAGGHSYAGVAIFPTVSLPNKIQPLLL